MCSAAPRHDNIQHGSIPSVAAVSGYSWCSRNGTGPVGHMDVHCRDQTGQWLFRCSPVLTYTGSHLPLRDGSESPATRLAGFRSWVCRKVPRGHPVDSDRRRSDWPVAGECRRTGARSMQPNPQPTPRSSRREGPSREVPTRPALSSTSNRDNRCHILAQCYQNDCHQNGRSRALPSGGEKHDTAGTDSGVRYTALGCSGLGAAEQAVAPFLCLGSCFSRTQDRVYPDTLVLTLGIPRMRFRSFPLKYFNRAQAS